VAVIRRLLHLLTVLCLLLCVAALLLWARSVTTCDSCFLTFADRPAAGWYRAHRLDSLPGRARYVYGQFPTSDANLKEMRARPLTLQSVPRDPPEHDFGGARPDPGPRFHLSLWSGPSGNPAEKHHFLEVPYWFIALCCLLQPSLSLRRTLRRRRRQRRGLCPNCAYDLRAMPGRCPECGTGTSPANYKLNDHADVESWGEKNRREKDQMVFRGA